MTPAPVRDERSLFAELVAGYETVLRSYPSRGADLFRALLRLHELENLKLGWRSAALSLPAERWMALWRPLGRLRTLDPESFQRGGPREFVGQGLLEGAPAPAADDPAAAELAWDRWGSRELLRTARSLPSHEEGARRIALALVRERDLQLVRRGVPGFGMTPEAIAASTALLGEELGEEAIESLCRWRPENGPLAPGIARRLGLRGSPPADWPALELALRRRRRALCRRAFRENPFCLAPAIAYLALKEEELRSVRAIAEAGGAGDVEDTLELVLAAGPLES